MKDPFPHCALRNRCFQTAVFLLVLFLWRIFSPAQAEAETSNLETRLERGEAVIERIEPWEGMGKAYRLIYLVDVPPDIFWRFKTDFRGRFLTTNRFIDSHRFVGRKSNVVITENRYANRPKMTFIWETTLFPSDRRLEYRLSNPEACAHRFHFGTIRLEPQGNRTRVTQTAWFDFPGVWFWYYNPWKGGMRDFLGYTAGWEQETAMRLKEKYTAPP